MFPPKKLCLMRLSSIGDVVHSLPVINTIKSQWPDTEITWVIGKIEYSLVANIPGIRFICFDKASGIKAYRHLYHSLHDEYFDVLLLMQLSLRASLASLCINAPIRIGFDRKRSKNLHSLFINRRIAYHPQQHVIDCFLEFTQALGIKEKSYVWNCCYTIADRQFIERHIIRDHKKILIVSPCSNHHLRNWTTAGYAAIADYAIQKHGMRVILTGSDNAIDHSYADAIIKRMSQMAINFVGKTNLNQLMALLKYADAVISPDSGPAHMANSVGAPVIGLYAATNPVRAAPYFSRQWCVNRYPDIAARFSNTPVNALAWGKKFEREGVMATISVAEVKEKLDQLLAATVH